MIGIYKITNPKGKIYIGQSVNIHQRKLNYKNFISNKNNIGPKLYNSFKKYSWENHIFEIIEECTINQLDENEIYWGIKFDVLNENGLNLKLGEGRGICSEETKQKMSIAHLGNKKRVGCKMNEHSKHLIGQKNSKPKPKGFMSKELKEKISKSNKGVSRNKGKKMNVKIILQYDLQGNFIKEWSSIKEANQIIKGDIHSCCKGKQKTAGSFKWKYK